MHVSVNAALPGLANVLHSFTLVGHDGAQVILEASPLVCNVLGWFATDKHSGRT